MARTRRRTIASRSSTSQAPRLTFQIIQSRTVPILEPVNLEEGDTALDAATNARAKTVLNTTVLLFTLVFSKQTLISKAVSL